MSVMHGQDYLLARNHNCLHRIESTIVIFWPDSQKNVENLSAPLGNSATRSRTSQLKGKAPFLESIIFFAAVPSAPTAR